MSLEAGNVQYCVVVYWIFVIREQLVCDALCILQLQLTDSNKSSGNSYLEHSML